MKSKKFLGKLLGLTVLASSLVGCASHSASSSTGNVAENLVSHSESHSSSNSTSTLTTVSTQTPALSDMFSARDKEIGYDENNSVSITLSDSGTKATSENVKISGNTITLTDEGTYHLTGNLSNGQIIIDAEKTDKLQIILDNVHITHPSSAPIYIKQADKVFLTLAKDTQNTLSVSDEFVAIDDNTIDAVIYSKDDLTLNGEGALAITTSHGNGITSKDDLVITSGQYTANVNGHGLEGKDSVRIAGGDFTLTTGKDGIHSDNADDLTLGFVYIAGGTFDITTEGDGIDGAAWVQIDEGDFTLTTGGGSANAIKTNTPPMRPEHDKGMPQGTQAPETTRVETTNVGTASTTTPSTKAIKATGNLTLNNGRFIIDSSDDSLHANGDVLIDGGTLELASGDDGIHADSNVTITNGNLTISKSYEGIEGQSIEIKGGEIHLVASDDGLNSAGGNDQSGMGGRPGQDPFASDENAYIRISGGKLYINASGDGIDSNGNLYVSGGETYVSGPTNGGNGALDYNGTAEISGGLFIATGTHQMAQNFGDSSTQGAMLITAQSMQDGAVILKDSTGKELLNYTPSTSYNSAVISLPELTQSQTYTVTLGSDTQTIEMTNLIYGSGGGFGGGGGRGGGARGGMNGQKPPQPPTRDTQKKSEIPPTPPS